MEEVWVTGLGAVSAAGRTLAEMEATLWSGAPVLPAPPARLLKLAAGLGLEEMSHPAFSLADDLFPDGFRHSARDTLALAEEAAGQALVSAKLVSAKLVSAKLASGKLASAKLASGGLSRPGADEPETGVVIGSTAGAAPHFLADYADLTRGRAGAGPGLRDFFACNPAAALAEKYGFSGPVMTIGDACCSGADAVGLGGALIASGRCRRALVGGADALSLIPYIGFRRLMIYDDRPCRPFDLERGGLNLGEGAACLLLEAPAAAQARGAEPLAKLSAYAAAADAHHLTAPHPEARGLRSALRAALAQAGLAAEETAFVSAHGTATPDNDRAEALALNSELPGVPLWAVKGATGHTLGAAGALEAVLTIAALNRGTLPPSPGFSRPDPALGLQPAKPGPLRSGAALSVSLGFGGANSALVFEKIA